MFILFALFTTIVDINEKALTLINRESFLMRNYLGPSVVNSNILLGFGDEREMLRSILHQNVLINLRTYDTHSLVLYANDHYNNFVHLYLNEGKQIVFLYNYGDEIVNLTIVDDSVSSLKSIQIAIVRQEKHTRMHVNEQNVTIDRGTLLLDEYANKPWINPEKGKSYQFINQSIK